MFKNGRVYEGEFIDDHMAEYPSFQIDIMNNQDLSGIRTTSPFGTGEEPEVWWKVIWVCSTLDPPRSY